MSSNRRPFLALRALLVALWAMAGALAPAHAAIDALDDPCQQTTVSAHDLGDPANLDQAFHAVHDCGTCHVHVLPAPAVQVLKPAPRSASHALAVERTVSSTRADGPYRPPQA